MFPLNQRVDNSMHKFLEFVGVDLEKVYLLAKGIVRFNTIPWRRAISCSLSCWVLVLVTHSRLVPGLHLGKHGKILTVGSSETELSPTTLSSTSRLLTPLRAPSPCIYLLDKKRELKDAQGIHTQTIY